MDKSFPAEINLQDSDGNDINKQTIDQLEKEIAMSVERANKKGEKIDNIRNVCLVDNLFLKMACGIIDIMNADKGVSGPTRLEINKEHTTAIKECHVQDLVPRYGCSGDDEKYLADLEDRKEKLIGRFEKSEVITGLQKKALATKGIYEAINSRYIIEKPKGLGVVAVLHDGLDYISGMQSRVNGAIDNLKTKFTELFYSQESSTQIIKYCNKVWDTLQKYKGEMVQPVGQGIPGIPKVPSCNIFAGLTVFNVFQTGILNAMTAIDYVIMFD